MTLLCPSAPADAGGAQIFGVVTGTAERRRVAYLDCTIDATDEIRTAVGLVHPNEVLRTAAPCAGEGCRHFDGRNCTLVSRVTALLPEVTDRPPPCMIRKDCRWWNQEGILACRRCPQVVTASLSVTDAHEAAARPPA